jgi:hypothetical protein
MERKEYNGWTNYETWLANLWIDNDQDSQEYWQARALDACTCCNDAEEAADMLAKALEDDADKRAEQVPAGFMQDMVNAGLREVNWQEIAEHMVADSDYEWPADEEAA